MSMQQARLTTGKKKQYGLFKLPVGTRHVHSQCQHFGVPSVHRLHSKKYPDSYPNLKDLQRATPIPWVALHEKFETCFVDEWLKYLMFLPWQKNPGNLHVSRSLF